jgi:hypothetical protein
VGDLSQEAGAVPRIVGRRRASVGYSRHRLERHLHHFMTAGACGGGDEADSAGIVLPGGVEGCSCDGCGVSSIEVIGTGRVDPLPIGGHGAS